MQIRRIVPNIVTSQEDMCREFYCAFLGLQIGMDMGWIVTFVSEDNPTAQISVVRGTVPQELVAVISLSIEVGDVDLAYKDADTRGYKVVYPLTDEPWGVRRFHVLDPNGIVVNVMKHVVKQDLMDSIDVE